MRIRPTIMRSPSTTAPLAVEETGPPSRWLTLARSNRCSPGPARLAPGVRAAGVFAAIGFLRDLKASITSFAGSDARVRDGSPDEPHAPPLPACGERVGVRGTFSWLSFAENPPHPPAF